jgi:hypothetical protein
LANCAVSIDPTVGNAFSSISDLSADSADGRGWAETSGAGREAAGFGEQRTV